MAIVAGSIFYKDDRMKRKEKEGKLEERKQGEKREKWLAELEARDREDRAWREGIEKEEMAMAGLRDVPEKVKRAGNEAKKAVEGTFKSKSMREQIDRDWWVRRTSEAWRRM